MSHFTSRFPYFLSAVVGVISGVYIFQPALEDIARISRENEAKYRMDQMEKSLAAASSPTDSPPSSKSIEPSTSSVSSSPPAENRTSAST